MTVAAVAQGHARPAQHSPAPPRAATGPAAGAPGSTLATPVRAACVSMSSQQGSIPDRHAIFYAIAKSTSACPSCMPSPACPHSNTVPHGPRRSPPCTPVLPCRPLLLAHAPLACPLLHAPHAPLPCPIATRCHARRGAAPPACMPVPPHIPLQLAQRTCNASATMRTAIGEYYRTLSAGALGSCKSMAPGLPPRCL